MSEITIRCQVCENRGDRGDLQIVGWDEGKKTERRYECENCESTGKHITEDGDEKLTGCLSIRPIRPYNSF